MAMVSFCSTRSTETPCRLAAGRLSGLEGAQLVEAQALEDPAHRGRRDADLGGDLLARHTLAAQGLDAFDHRLRRRLAQVVGSRAAVLQARHAFLVEAADPFAHRAQANTYGFTGGLRRLPTQNHFDHALSTAWRQTGILVDVHSALQGSVDVSTTSASSTGAG